MKKEKYVQDLQKKLSANYDESIGKESAVVKFYRKQLDSKLKEIKQTDIEASKIYEQDNYFNKMLDFEKAHGIKRYGYTKKTGMPNNAVVVNISMFDMSVLNDKGVQKTFKKVYVEFPDNISEDDKNTYLELLKKAQEQGKQVQKSMHKWIQLEKEYESAIENYNKAKSGQITKIGSQINNQQKQAIRESSNPYYKQYKELEQKYNALRTKRTEDLTSEEASLLVQLPQIMRQLKNASNSYEMHKAVNSNSAPRTESKAETNVEATSEAESSSNFRVTNVDEKLSYKVEDGSKFSDEHSLGFSYNKNDWEFSVSGSKTETYSGGKLEHEGFFDVDVTYSKGKCSFSPGLEFTETDTNRTWTPSFTASYNDNSNSMTFKASRVITTVTEATDDKKDGQNKPETTYSTDLELGWKKMFKNGTSTNVSSSVKFDKNQGNEYMLNADAMFPLLKDKLAKHNLGWSVGAELTGNYFGKLQATNIEPGIATSLNYSKDDFSADLSLNENISFILQGGDTLTNSMFMASGSVGYKQLSFNAGFNSTQNSYLDMISVNAGISYSVPKVGKFSLTSSYSDSVIGKSDQASSPIKEAIGKAGERTKDFNVSVGYSAPLDVINGWFTKSKKNK